MVLTLPFILHLAHRKAAGKRSVYCHPAYCSVSIKNCGRQQKKTEYIFILRWRGGAEKMRITQLMTTNNIVFQVAAAEDVLDKKKIYL